MLNEAKASTITPYAQAENAKQIDDIPLSLFSITPTSTCPWETGKCFFSVSNDSSTVIND